jgi:DNA gyrase subunit B
VQVDEEHQAFALAIEDRSSGYPRHHRIDQDFVTTGEFRTLTSSYQDVKGIRGPMIVKTAGSTESEEAVDDGTTASADETAIGGAPLDEATKLAAEPKAMADQLIAEAAAGAQTPAPKAQRDAEVRVESLDELVEFFTAAGKKGVAINRYKGLGEMNPDTLWETTMNPATRTLAQVRAEDHMEADLMFTTLMGDQVEPRRKFIEDNALDVKNLDI